MGKGGNKGKKANKGKTAKDKRTVRLNTQPAWTLGRFPLLGLPTEIIEDIAEVLKDQYQLRALANLNVGNKYLPDVTTRFLWESVRWTIHSWLAVARALDEGVPAVLQHVKHIHLINRGDFGDSDREFWTPLFTRPLPQLENKTYGQLAHIFFPNLRYLIKLDAPPLRGHDDRSVNPNARVYVSDQNVIERFDTAPLYKIVCEIQREYFGDTNIPPPSFADQHLYPSLEVERLNRHSVSASAANVKESVTRQLIARPDPDDPAGRRLRRATFTIPLEYMPFRHLALFSLGVKITIRFDLLLHHIDASGEHGTLDEEEASRIYLAHPQAGRRTHRHARPTSFRYHDGDGPIA